MPDSKTMEMDLSMEGAETNTSAESDLPNFLEVACVLRDVLHDLIGGVEEVAGVRKVLEFAGISQRKGLLPAKTS